MLSRYTKAAKPCKRSRAHRTRRPPALERLEDRTVPSTIQGTFFNDLNQNGALDPGEPCLAGWTAFLDGNRSGIVDAGELTAVTDADGNYVLDTTGLPPQGVYEGDEYDFLGSVLEVGSGGRWIPTSQSYLWVNRTDEPTALGRNFGFHFQPDVGRAPVGGETLVNVATAGSQGYVDVAADAQGNFVVAWVTDTVSGRNLVARRFDADGTPAPEGEILVATSVSTELFGSNPVLARADNGKFALAWTAINSSNGNSVVYTRAYATNGTPLTPTAVQVTQINKTYRAHVQDIAMDADGDYAVLFRDAKSSLQGTYWTPGAHTIQRYNNTGAVVGKSIGIADPNVFGSGAGATMDMDDAGNFVVAWTDFTQIYAQRYTSAGKKTGALLVAATKVTSGSILLFARVAMNGSGQFVVNWKCGGMGEARLYSATGAPSSGTAVVGPEMNNPTIDEEGNVTILGVHAGAPPGVYDPSWHNVAVRHLNASGLLEPMTLVNTTTQGEQTPGAVAATGTDTFGNGSFVVVWSGCGPGDAAGVFFRCYAPIAAPLVAAALPETPSAEELSPGALQPFLDEALGRWEAGGADIASLGTIDVRIADLGGATLAVAAGSTIWLDDDAAGWGWFVDPTPADDGEFTTPGDQGEQGRIDLLSVLMHEVGHLLGQDHSADGVMAEALGTGERWSAEALIDAAFADDLSKVV
jgi:hypothetical protein